MIRSISIPLPFPCVIDQMQKQAFGLLSHISISHMLQHRFTEIIFYQQNEIINIAVLLFTYFRLALSILELLEKTNINQR